MTVLILNREKRIAFHTIPDLFLFEGPHNASYYLCSYEYHECIQYCNCGKLSIPVMYLDIYHSKTNK